MLYISIAVSLLILLAIIEASRGLISDFDGKNNQAIRSWIGTIILLVISFFISMIPLLKNLIDATQ